MRPTRMRIRKTTKVYLIALPILTMMRDEFKKQFNKTIV